VGDFALNKTPSAGAATGWICTVAGTPGTWIALAPTSFSALSDVAAAAPNDGNMLYFDNDTGKWTNTGAVSYDQAGSAFKLTGIAQKWGDGTRVGILSYDGTAVYMGAESNHPLVVYTNNTERLRIDTAGKITDQYGNIRAIPAVGTKTGSYTLQTADVGRYVQVGSGGSITIPDSTFAEGDAVSIFNNTSGNVTITCSITTAYIAGTDSDKATMTLATRGVATVLFISSTVCVVSGNVS
jgi:hypothetical protein